MRSGTRIASLALGLAALGLLGARCGGGGIPTFSVTSIGSLVAGNTYTTATALNLQGDTVGWAIVSGQLQAFLYTDAHGLTLLPPAPGDASSVALGVGDRDASGGLWVAGETRASVYSEPGRAVLWRFGAASGVLVETVEVGTLPGFAQSSLAGVNHAGIAVGYSTSGGFSGSPAMVFDANASSLLPLDFPARPADVSNDGWITGGSWRARLDPDLAVGQLEDLGAPPDHGVASLAAINDLGFAAGRASASFTDGAGRFVHAIVRFTTDWQVLAERSAFDGANDLNNAADVVGNLGFSGTIDNAVLYVNRLGNLYVLQELMAEGFRGTFVRAPGGINDAGQIAASGTGGAMRLDPAGPMPVPTAPDGLTAVTQPGTLAHPNGTIELAWTDTSVFTTSFQVERRPGPAGEPDFTGIRLSGNRSDGILEPLELATTYDYRVRACGLAGCGPYSNVASATSPSQPADTTPPVVGVQSPADGAQVSRTVQIVVEATDAGGLNLVEVQVSPSMGSSVLCSDWVPGATHHTLSCSWNTRKLAPGPYTLYGYASDLLGSWAIASIAVEVVP